jgi:O-antigen ligase
LALVLALGTSQSVRDAATSTDRLEQVSEGRFGLVRGGLTIWKEEPVVGAGLGGFEPRFEETLTPTEQRRIRVVVSHNAPVTVLSEQGVVGFVLLLVLIGSAVTAMTRGSWRTGGNDSWAIWTLQAILAGIFVHALLYSALFEDPATWVLTASALAIAAHAKAAVPAAEPAREEPRGLAPSPGTT